MEEVQSIFDKGFAKVRTVVSDTSIEQRDFMKAFVRLCSDGWLQGWHESNGGNLTYRMRNEEISACRSYFNEALGAWTAMGVQADSLRGAFFVTTGAGKFFRNIGLDPAGNIGIVEINQKGDSWRIVWGLKGGHPTSEFTSHFVNHAVRLAVSGGANRVMYHAHPANAIALTLVEPLDSRTLSRLLWKSMTESFIILPGGVGVVPWMVPGGKEIAIATSGAMEDHAAIVWAQHGVFCSGADFDTAFGYMHTIDKAAGIYLTARAANGGGKPEEVIADSDLRQAAQTLGLSTNEAYLN